MASRKRHNRRHCQQRRVSISGCDSSSSGYKSEFRVGLRCFSGLEGVEKPNPKIYEIALERAGNIAPQEALHIGDSMRKDYEPAKSIGMHALLLDRFKTPDAVEWRKAGAVVLPDLVATGMAIVGEVGLLESRGVSDFVKVNHLCFIFPL
ncbi:Rhythmically expressed gene 2 protein [Arachis hypogaea]|nr:Rhythmically expressed gene 2 protein [Arachis hypogaea]